MRMKTQILTEIDGRVVNESEFTQKVSAWGENSAIKMQGNIEFKARSKTRTGKLQESIISKVRKTSGIANSVGFKFESYGIFRAYGVGRGYIHTSAGVIRGQRTKEYYKGNKKNKNLFTAYGTGGIKRSPLDWFDSVIKNNIDKLADITADYYGDKMLVNKENEKNYLIIK